jgi:transglutaminase-like putative cysteine protease
MKIQRRTRKDQTSFGSLDYLLMSVGTCFAVYSAGVSVGAVECGRIFVVMVLCGSAVSLAVRRWVPSDRIIGLDAFFYTVATFSAVVFNGSLNQLLPAEGIPTDVTTAGWLCWMLSLGSFFTWRDRTLLFQAVPTIALFGLIGCYDTFAPAPFLFFGFLLCLATLLGRSHSRDMLRQAVQSGYFNRADSPLTVSEHPEQSPDLYEDIKRGPWRWLAGPEWALASGLVIVALSVLGAPVIRQAVEPISGAIHILAPRRVRNNVSTSQPAVQQSSYEVGRGPLNQNGPPHPQFIAKMDQVRYLRDSTFDLYNRHGWSSSVATGYSPAFSGMGEIAIDEMTHKSKFHLTITPVLMVHTLPLPAEVTSLYPTNLKLDSGGSATSAYPATGQYEVEGVESKTSPTAASTDLPEEIKEHCLDKTEITPAVAEFAANAARGKTDFEKAEAIRNAISVRCNYTKQATAVPADQEAADYFLNNSRVGYCDLFATAMVECARAIGIPAHFCIGYLPDAASRDEKGETIVYDQDYHAWAELYFQGVGWVVFDATAGSKSLDPEKNNNSNGAAFGILTKALDVAIGIGILVVGGLFIAPWFKRKRKPAPAKDRAEVRRAYLAFSRALASASKERRNMPETAREYVLRASSLFPELQVAATSLNSKLEAAMYGPVAPTEQTLKTLMADVREFRQLLKQRQRTRSQQLGFLKLWR